MLYFFYGNDIDTARKKIDAVIAGAHKKKENAEVLVYTDETFDPRILPELIHGQGLFEQKHIVVLKRVMENDEAKTALFDARKDIAASDNLFIMHEMLLDARTKKAFETVADKAEKVEKKNTPKLTPFNRFVLADALVNGDRQALWVRYRRALADGAATEELHGILLWQARAMLAAQRFDSPEAAGLKPFVYQKARRTKRSPEATEQLARGLLALYHDARRRGHDLEERLEQFILQL